MTDTKAKKHIEEIEQLKTRCEELENNWKRALADYQNLQKRNTEERSSIIDFSSFHLLGRFLSILDNLELLYKHNKDKALEMVIKELKTILLEEQAVEVNSDNTLFDSACMDALETVDTENEAEDGMVLETVRKGYMFKNKLLRPALVKVGKLIS